MLFNLPDDTHQTHLLLPDQQAMLRLVRFADASLCCPRARRAPTPQFRRSSGYWLDHIVFNATTHESVVSVAAVKGDVAFDRVVCHYWGVNRPNPSHLFSCCVWGSWEKWDDHSQLITRSPGEFGFSLFSTFLWEQNRTSRHQPASSSMVAVRHDVTCMDRRTRCLES